MPEDRTHPAGAVDLVDGVAPLGGVLAGTGGSLRGARLLVVDDSAANLHALVHYLRSDYALLVARDGATALDLAERERPDLILLDVGMPGMDGYDVCRRLKSSAETERIPVIFLTGRQDEADELTGLELGAVDYIVKPFSLPIVGRRIRTHLELKAYHDRLQEQTLIDGLTGIPNRRCFDEFLQQAWANAVRLRAPLSLLLADIDQFKSYNDRYGHPAGDECLRQVASALVGALTRSTDLVARYGGEEFAFVLPGTDRDGAHRVAGRIRDLVRDRAIAHAHGVEAGVVTVSIGLASDLPEPDASPGELIAAADQALYRAKQAGRDRIEE